MTIISSDHEKEIQFFRNQLPSPRILKMIAEINPPDYTILYIRTQTFIPSTTHIFSPRRTEEAVMKLRNIYVYCIYYNNLETSSVFVHTVKLFFPNGYVLVLYII